MLLLPLFVLVPTQGNEQQHHWVLRKSVDPDDLRQYLYLSNSPCISCSLNAPSVKWVHSTHPSNFTELFVVWTCCIFREIKSYLTRWSRSRVHDTVYFAKSDTKICLYSGGNFKTLSEIWMCLRCTYPYSEPLYLTNPEDVLAVMLSMNFI